MHAVLIDAAVGGGSITSPVTVSMKSISGPRGGPLRDVVIVNLPPTLHQIANIFM